MNLHVTGKSVEGSKQHASEEGISLAEPYFILCRAYRTRARAHTHNIEEGMSLNYMKIYMCS